MGGDVWSIMRRSRGDRRRAGRKRAKGKGARSALDVLTARERRCSRRGGSARTREPEELGRELSISGERVRQIEIVAFEKVKRAATGVCGRPSFRPERWRLRRQWRATRRAPLACPPNRPVSKRRLDGDGGSFTAADAERGDAAFQSALRRMQQRTINRVRGGKPIARAYDSQSRRASAVA